MEKVKDDNLKLKVEELKEKLVYKSLILNLITEQDERTSNRDRNNL